MLDWAEVQPQQQPQRPPYQRAATPWPQKIVHSTQHAQQQQHLEMGLIESYSQDANINPGGSCGHNSGGGSRVGGYGSWTLGQRAIGEVVRTRVEADLDFDLDPGLVAANSESDAEALSLCAAIEHLDTAALQVGLPEVLRQQLLLASWTSNADQVRGVQKGLCGRHWWDFARSIVRG